MQTIHPRNSAQLVAIARAVHQLLDEPRILDDSLALSLLGTELRDAVVVDPFQYNDPGARSMRAGIVARTLLAEEYLDVAVADGVGQIVVLGAGMDSYGVRQGTTIPKVCLFEVDRPEMLTQKQAMITESSLHVPHNLRFVPADLQQDDWVDVLVQHGFDRHKPAAISCLGLTPYLDVEQVRRLLSEVSELPPGSCLVFDYRVCTELLNTIEQAIVAFSERVFAAMGEPWLSQFAPASLVEELETMGFAEVRNFDVTELNRRYFARRKDGLQVAGGGFNYIVARR
ncbi:class I SAM-dependent methyltransferase [Marinobacter sp. GN3S48]|uniref:class I SAM-dependent methyltransferase n=1 Tax=Marinobacter sp. GN3S48 TaxID=3382302 RepID=UPI00387A906D